jgi:hypothetical protein
MKFPSILGSLALVAIVYAFSCDFANAESPYERDLKQLIEQRDKAITAATAPIIDRFKANAEQLLRRATQAGDLDAANKIKASIGGGTPVSTTGPIKDLRKQLSGTTWKAVPSKPLRGGFAERLTFTEKTLEPGGYKYEAQSHNAVTVTFTGGDKEIMNLSPDGKRLQFTQGKTDYTYELASE